MGDFLSSQLFFHGSEIYKKLTLTLGRASVLSLPWKIPTAWQTNIVSGSSKNSYYLWPSQKIY